MIKSTLGFSLLFVMLTSVFLARVSGAGVRSVGNGGGYAEMQAILANLRIASLVHPCLSGIVDCDLTTTEKTNIEAATNSAFDLQLLPDCNDDPIRTHGPHAGTISACALYNLTGNSPQAKDFLEIASWVLTTRLVASGEDVHSAFALSTKVFAKFSQTEDSAAVGLDSGSFIFHLLAINFSRQSTMIFSVEGDTQTLDLSEAAYAALDCAKPAQIESASITSTEEVSPNRGLAQLDLRWICAGQSWSGRLNVFFGTSALEVDPSSIIARISDKH